MSEKDCFVSNVHQKNLDDFLPRLIYLVKGVRELMNVTRPRCDERKKETVIYKQNLLPSLRKNCATKLLVKLLASQQSSHLSPPPHETTFQSREKKHHTPPRPRRLTSERVDKKVSRTQKTLTVSSLPTRGKALSGVESSQYLVPTTPTRTHTDTQQKKLTNHGRKKKQFFLKEWKAVDKLWTGALL